MGNRRRTILVVLSLSVVATTAAVAILMMSRAPSARDLDAERAATEAVDWDAFRVPIKPPARTLNEHVAGPAPDDLAELQKDGRNENRPDPPFDTRRKLHSQLEPLKFDFDRLPSHSSLVRYSLYYKKTPDSLRQFLTVLARHRDTRGFEWIAHKATDHLIHDLVKQQATPQEVRALLDAAVESLASLPPESPDRAGTHAYILALQDLCDYHLDEKATDWDKGIMVFDLETSDVVHMFKAALTVPEVPSNTWRDPRRKTYRSLLEASGPDLRKLELMTLALNGAVRRGEGLITLLWMLDGAIKWLGCFAETHTEPGILAPRAEFALAAIQRVAEAGEYADLSDIKPIEPIRWGKENTTASLSVSTLDQLLRCAAALTVHLPPDQRSAAISSGLKASLDKLDGVAYFTDHAAKTRAGLRSAGWDV